MLLGSERRKVERGDARRLRELLNLDQDGLRDRSLSQARGAFIESDHIGISVFLERGIGTGVFRVEPRPCRNLRNTAHEIVAHPSRRQKCPAIVIGTHDIALFNASLSGISRRQIQDLSAIALELHADRAREGLNKSTFLA